MTPQQQGHAKSPSLRASTSSKYFLKELSIARLYTVLLLTFSYFVFEMVIAHVAHSLILQVNAYHMLYNILALLTSIATTKISRDGSNNNLKTTFGWTRIDVCGAVASLCFLAALCFSVVIESLQAMLHASHHETMKMPLIVLVLGVVGLLVNFMAYLIVGGYTHQQKSFLGSHRHGDDIVISPNARRGPTDSNQTNYGGPLEALRDFLGSVLVVAVALVVYLWNDERAVMIDPLLTIIEVFVLAALSVKYAKEAGYILLLTIPDNIDVDLLIEDLHSSFPEIVDVHEFHVWQLNPSRIIATAHVVLREMDNCWVVQNNIISFLEDKGITHVTLQPEFINTNESTPGEASPETLKRRQCFLPCSKDEKSDCHGKTCCLSSDDENDPDHDPFARFSHGHSHGLGGHSHGGKRRSSSHSSLHHHHQIPMGPSSKSLNDVYELVETSTQKNSNNDDERGRSSSPPTSAHLLTYRKREASCSSSSSDEDEDAKVTKPMI